MKKKLDGILLIDDDKITNYIHEKLINKMGISKKIDVVYNGREGLEFILACYDSAELPDLIFLDLNMPVLDGFEFLERFQNLEDFIKNKISIVVLTTSVHQQDKEKLKHINVEQVNKPLTEEKLINVYKKHINRSVKRKLLDLIKYK